MVFKVNQIILRSQVIILLLLLVIENTFITFADGASDGKLNGNAVAVAAATAISSSQSHQNQKYLLATTSSTKEEKSTRDAWITTDVHNSRPSFSPSFHSVSKAHKTRYKHVKENLHGETSSSEDRRKSTNNSIEADSLNGKSSGISISKEDMKALLERLSNSNSDLNNNLDLDVITQAFRFVKFDSHLNTLALQLSTFQNSHEQMLEQMSKQDAKLQLVLNQMASLVNFVGGESAKMKSKEESFSGEIQKMNQRLDKAVEKLIQSSTTSQIMFELSKESLQHMDKVEQINKQVLNEVKAVKTELGDVGQVSIQTIYNIHTLEENLMAGLEKMGNRTVYALRQDAEIIGPKQLLLESGYDEGNSIHFQGDESNSDLGGASVKKVSNNFGGGRGNAKAVATSTTTSSENIKAKSLVSCLSRKRLVNEKRPRDCGEIQLLGHSKSGVYTIFSSINSNQPTKVLCDLETEGGGWTVFQKRTDNQENFFRSWGEYQKGFGNADKQYWIGLEILANISELGDQELRIELTDWKGLQKDANYRYFRVSNATDKFRLHVADYFGTAGDSLIYHNGMAFSTKDQDNDMDKIINCADRYEGAWWYKNCHQSNLNGVYIGTESYGKHSSYAMGINWYSWHGYYYSIRTVEMKMRNRQFLTAKESK